MPLNLKRRRIIRDLKYDTVASIVVFFVALPLCLGIALASGAPLFAGVIAGVIGGIVVGSISNSAIGVSGPAAGLAVIVLNAISDLGSYEIFLLAVILAGLIQILLGILKAGLIAYYFPSAVIKGMLSAIGIILILKQIPYIFGLNPELLIFNSQIIDFVEFIFNMVSFNALFVGFFSLGILLLWELYLTKKSKVFNILQGSLVAVFFGIIYQAITIKFFSDFAITKEHLVQVPIFKTFTEFKDIIIYPDFMEIYNYKVWVVAFTLAIIASLETLLCVEATDKLDRLKRTTNTNRELLAQGFGNFFSGLIGGLPITQVVVRSSANINSGARSKLSTIFHGFLLLFSVMLIPSVLNLIPLSVLAAILLVVGYKLAKPTLFVQMYKLGLEQFIPFIVTVIGIVFTDLLKGIVFGILTALFIILRVNFRNSHFLHKKEIDNGHHQVILTLSEEVTFLNKGSIIEQLRKIPKKTELIIDISNSVYIHYDIKEIIENFRKTAIKKDIIVKIIGSEKLMIADH